MRDLEREKTKMEATEKKLISDIKAAAKKNQVKTCQIMVCQSWPMLRIAILSDNSSHCDRLAKQAKDLVRTRKHMEKFTNLCAQLRVMSLSMTEVASQQALAESMKNVTKAMTTLNRQINLPALQQTMAEFQKQSEAMGMKQEMMEDAMAEVFDEEADAVESEGIVSQIFDELNIKLTDGMAVVPPPGAVVAAGAAVEV